MASVHSNGQFTVDNSILDTILKHNNHWKKIISQDGYLYCQILQS